MNRETHEQVVQCPGSDQPARVVVERDVTVDLQPLELFRCSLLDENPNCRRECLEPELREPER